MPENSPAKRFHARVLISRLTILSALGASALFISRCRSESPPPEPGPTSGATQVTSPMLAPTPEPTDEQALWSLPRDERLRAAEELLQSSDGHRRYLGATTLVQEGERSKALDALGEFIASGDDETLLGGRLGYDWAQLNPDLYGETIVALGRHLLQHRGKSAPAERDRMEQWLMALTDTPPPFSEAAIDAWLTASEAADRRGAAPATAGP